MRVVGGDIDVGAIMRSLWLVLSLKLLVHRCLQQPSSQHYIIARTHTHMDRDARTLDHCSSLVLSDSYAISVCIYIYIYISHKNKRHFVRRSVAGRFVLEVTPKSTYKILLPKHC